MEEKEKKPGDVARFPEKESLPVSSGPPRAGGGVGSESTMAALGAEKAELGENTPKRVEKSDQAACAPGGAKAKGSGAAGDGPAISGQGPVPDEGRTGENTPGRGEETGEAIGATSGNTKGPALAPSKEPFAPKGDADGENTPERGGKNPNRKKLIALIATAGAVLLILAAVLISSAVRNRRPPALDDIRARVEQLVLASREVNEIFFGEGLPVYERIYVPDYTLDKYQVTYNEKEYNRSYYTFTDHEGRRMLKYQYCLAAGSDTNGDGKNDRYEYPDLEFGGFLTVNEVNDYRYAELFFEEPEEWFYTGETENGAGEAVTYWLVRREGYAEPFYYSADDDPYYDYVTENCPYQSTAEIRALAETVYSTEYLAAISESVFTGITVSDRESGTLFARYIDKRMEDGYEYLMKSNSFKSLEVKRVYDFSTMTMTKPSNSTYVTVEMETYLEGHEEERLVVRVALVLEDGQWMLDSPTY